MYDVKKLFIRNDRTRDPGGFTIIEVMMATAVMALVITTSITTMQRGFLALDTARNLTLASQVMQSEMEKTRMVPWATINAYPAGPTAVTIHPDFTSNPAIGSRFTLTREVAVVPTTTGVGMKQITFTITWKSYDARILSRSFITYYGEGGLYDYYFNSI
jgi:prepilin-type N-terminal cleavage/methylation domain-containing protein